ncbi:IclR family transcriptional regulator [Peribacillus muralis]|uniref:IclR family transcriptional regulator n=1 Tax=Peribacillus muralis TaxID=264697 RepID=UPI001F4ECD3F|nr:IclR family transcriptional regulator [Peribacillus muralis]MCK1993545.1 IclR family transcriptional regulator [Peribacillus muralis]MCK2014167.1 IclR family transcriptional regulator [Peribacillus muralis]
MTSDNQPYGTVLLKGAKILDFLSASDEPQPLQMIAKQTELTNSTALKILDTLILIGYVHKDLELKKFSLGTSLIRYAIKAMNQLEIKQIAQPHLEELQRNTNETVHLGILDQTSVVYVTKIESKNPVCLYSKVGKTIPLYCSAMGKAILADQSDAEINQYLATNSLVKITNKTITTKSAFNTEIDQIRERGYAFDDSEHEEEIFCVGASITLNSKNYGALSVSVPTYRLTDEVLQNMIASIKKCKASIINDLQ